MNNNTKIAIRFNLCTVLFIVFLTLKLTGNIDWSWWWVTAPLWIPLGLFFGILFVVIIILGILALPQAKDILDGRW